MNRSDVHRLVHALLAERREAGIQHDLDRLYYRPLGGGATDAFVALMWLDGLPTLILKAGQDDAIVSEVEGRSTFAGRVEPLDALQLAGYSEAIDVEIEGRSERWRAMAYPYVGALSYASARDFADFETIFNEFISSSRGVSRPDEASVTRWLETLFSSLRDRAEGGGLPEPGVAAMPLSRYLTPLNWAGGLSAVLSTASAFVAGVEDLQDFRTWWETALERETIAPFPNMTVLHGDLRFANVLVNRRSGEVELIDFARVGVGHVFQDLARFEADLLFRLTPPAGRSPAGASLEPEERRARLLELAIGGASFSQLVDPDDPENPHVLALRLLRSIYDSLWHIGTESGRDRMYLWFLLAETLKRLLWFEDVFTSESGRLALLRAIVMLRRSLSEADPAAPAFSSAARLVRELGCIGAYVPTRGTEAIVNRDRNRAKARALLRAAENGSDVSLLAETGNSYLHFRGPFFPEVEAILRTGTMKVVLAIPFFLEAHGISAAFRTTDLDSNGFHEPFLRKFRESSEGVRALQEACGNRLDVRVACYGLGATMLQTSDRVFFEPYLRSDRTVRHRRLFDTFELELDARNTHVGRLFAEHFAFYWDTGLPLLDVVADEQAYLALLSELKELWRGPAKATNT